MISFSNEMKQEHENRVTSKCKDYVETAYYLNDAGQPIKKVFVIHFYAQGSNNDCVEICKYITDNIAALRAYYKVINNNNAYIRKHKPRYIPVTEQQEINHFYFNKSLIELNK